MHLHEVEFSGTNNKSITVYSLAEQTLKSDLKLYTDMFI